MYSRKRRIGLDASQCCEEYPPRLIDYCHKTGLSAISLHYLLRIIFCLSVGIVWMHILFSGHSNAGVLNPFIFLWNSGAPCNPNRRRNIKFVRVDNGSIWDGVYHIRRLVRGRIGKFLSRNSSLRRAAEVRDRLLTLIRCCTFSSHCSCP